MRSQRLKTIAQMVVGALVVVGLYAYLAHVYGEAEPLEIGPDTTYFDGPLREDGTIDYYAALNGMLGEGVTPENNAFVVIAELIPQGPERVAVLRSWRPGPWREEVRHEVFGLLGVAVPDDEADYFVEISAYARQRRDDPRWTERLEPDDEYPYTRALWQQQWRRASQRPWSAEDLPLIAEWIEAHDAVLDRLSAGIQREAYWEPYVPTRDGPTGNPLIRDRTRLSGWILEMAQALRVRAMHQLHQGATEAAIEDVRNIKRLSQHLEEPFLLSQRMGIAIGGMTRPVIAALAGHEGFTAEQARQLKVTLGGWEQRFQVEHDLGLRERITALDEAQQGSVVLEVYVLDSGEPDDWVPYPTLDRNYAMRQINAHYDRFVEAVAAPTREQRLARVKAYRDKLDEVELGRGYFGRSVLLGGRAWADAVLALLVFDTSVDYGFAFDDLAMAEQLEHVALAVAIHRREEGSYPASLEDLAADLLDEAPLDIFDPGGNPIRYRVEDERVVVYSVGGNGEDNGGVDRDLVIEWSR